MTDYMTNDTDLTTVANAIRTKGGTSASLSFPDGYASAIAAIPTGVTPPTKGFVPTEWDSSGYVTKGKLYGMTSIPEYYFYRHMNSSFFIKLEDIEFINCDIYSIGQYAFATYPMIASSYGLKSISISSTGMDVIRSCAFAKNTRMTRADIHCDYITAIASDAFFGCNNLTDIYVSWSEGEVANAPWGATNATIHYNS